ncbi:MAG TPA: hypothetical protein VEO74_17520 [Thermoanaerobaculia bacterium]|nr:hypothetical protein [Thermoanaerobaculia bacterium]
MLLALFLIDLAAGLVVFLPLVGRRNAGVKFYRLVFIISGALAACAAAAHAMAGVRELAIVDAVPVALTIFVWFVLRYPKRLVFRVPAALLGASYLVAAVAAWRAGTQAPLAWSIAGALASVALLGSVNLAMILGHWYLVVRGMDIDPLKRLTIATLATSIARIAVVAAALCATGVWHEIAIRQGIFFWMRGGWGLIGPLLLYPMVWGTVRIRSTMAATGILYVDVVAVVIGEVLGGWLSAIAHVPV